MDDPAPAKLALRDQLLAGRRSLSLVMRNAVAERIAERLLGTIEIRQAATVAAYVAVGREPGTALLLEGLRDLGKRVILPVLQSDNDLAWAAWESASDLAPAPRGLLEPVGERLPVEAIATADAVLVPGLAVDRTGMRLGRGGGSYDRALARVPVGTFTCVLLHDHEILDHVPTEPHDRPVAAAVTDRRLVRFSAPA